MSLQPERYSAFISYRHVEHDRVWAIKVLNELETYRTPRQLVRSGHASRIRHLFRDEDEMPASSDLSRQIEDALARSDFLIVICSPETPKSLWVRREIELFRALGRGDHIIAILISGEPSQSYPPEIYGAPLGPQGPGRSEPYAADARPNQSESARRIGRRVILKLAAPILGCTFDELAQRDRQRRVRRIQQLSGAGIVCTTLMGALGGLWWHDSGRKLAAISRITADKLAEIATDASNSNHEDAALRFAVLAARQDLTLNRPSSGRAELIASLSHLKSHMVFRGHEGAVELLAYGHGGTQMLTAGSDSTVRLWDTSSGRNLATLSGFEGPVHHIAMSPNGSEALISFGLAQPEIWDLHSAKRKITLKGHTATVPWLEYSADGSMIASASLDKTVRLWNAQTGEPLRVIAPNIGFLSSVSFSPSGRLVAVTSLNNGIAAIFDVVSGRKVASLDAGEAHAFLNSANFSPDGTKLVTAASDKTAHIWNIRTGQQIMELRHGQIVTSANFSPDGKSILTTELFGRSAIIWDLATGARIHEFLGHADHVISAAFSPDGKWVITASMDGTSRLWRVHPDAALVFPGWAGSSGNAQLAFTPDDRNVVVANNTKLLSWNTQTRHLDIDTPVPFTRSLERSVALSSDGSTAFIITDEGDGLLVNIPAAKVVTDIPNLRRINSVRMENLTFSPDGTKLFIQAERFAGILSPQTGKVTAEIPALGRDKIMIKNLSFCSDDSRIVAVPLESTFARVKVVEAREGAESTDVGDAGLHGAATFSRDCGKLVIADTNIAVWRISPPSLMKTILTAGTQIADAEFNDGGSEIVAASADDTVRVWDVRSGKELAALSGHKGAVTEAVFSHDGSKILSGGDDGSVRLWDVPYLAMTTDDLVKAACAERIAGASKLSRSEMQTAGFSDEQPQLDVCAPSGAS